MNELQTDTSSHTKAAMRILRRTCQHEQQDAMHGTFQRAHNPCKGSPKTKFRCTVCRIEKEGK